MVLSRSLKLTVLGLALLAAGCDRQSGEKAQPQASASPPAQGQPAKGQLDTSHKGSRLPDFTLSDPAGKQLKLADLKGKPVLINLWATWCAPCIKELPQLDALAAKVRVVTVSQDMEPAKVAGFLQERGIKTLPAWLDPKNDLSFHYGTGTLPTTIYYDAEGREVWRYVGERDWSSAETDALLAPANAVAKAS